MSGGEADPRRVTITDPQVLRALAHPARLAIMEHLSTTGEAVTATGCAEIVGLSPSATSYHLRELKKYGLLEEAPSRGDARERLWRSAVQSWQLDLRPDTSAETQAAEQTLMEVYLARDFDRIRDWIRTARTEPREWTKAAVIAGPVLLMTADELTALNADLEKLLAPYRRRARQADPPQGARIVVFHYAALPQS